MTRNYIGIDLSKDWLDIYDPRCGHRRIPNTAPELQRFLSSLGPGDILVFEATSLCDGLILRLASAAGQPFHRLNPLHGWHFAQSLNRPKTDRIPSRPIASQSPAGQWTPGYWHGWAPNAASYPTRPSTRSVPR